MKKRIGMLALLLAFAGPIRAQLEVQHDALHLRAATVSYVNILANDSNASGIAPTLPQVVPLGTHVRLGSVAGAPRMLRVSLEPGAPASGTEDLVIGVKAGAQTASNTLRVCWGDVAECAIGVNHPGSGCTDPDGCDEPSPEDCTPIGLCVYVDGVLSSNGTLDIVPPAPLFAPRPAGETSEAAVTFVNTTADPMLIGQSSSSTNIRLVKLDGSAYENTTVAAGAQLQVKLRATHAAGLTAQQLHIQTSFIGTIARFHIDADASQAPSPDCTPVGLCVYVDGVLSSNGSMDIVPPSPLFPARAAGETSEAAVTFVNTTADPMLIGQSSSSTNIRLVKLDGSTYENTTVAAGAQLQVKLRATHAAGLTDQQLHIQTSFIGTIARFQIDADALQAPSSDCTPIGLCVYVDGVLSSNGSMDIVPPNPLFPARAAGETSEAVVTFVNTTADPMLIGHSSSSTNIRLVNLDGSAYTNTTVAAGAQLQVKLRATHAAGLTDQQLHIQTSFIGTIARFRVDADVASVTEPKARLVPIRVGKILIFVPSETQ